MTTSHVLYPQLARGYPTAVRAAGSWVVDAEGRRYLDACSGAIVVNLGHGLDEIEAAIRRQLDSVAFVYRTQFTSIPAEGLARDLVEVAPGDLDRVHFTNSGSEATEAAVRLVLQYWQEVGQSTRTVVVSRHGSYHGATLGAVAMSGFPARRRVLEGVLPDWPMATAANCHDCPFGLRPSSCSLDCASSVEDCIERAGAERVAAVVLEPVVGASGGAVPAPAGYLRRVADICHDHDVLLVADEVITGLGRSGRWFACDLEGVVPDVLVLGKGLSAGYSPLGAVLVGPRIHEAIARGSGEFSLGHTYAANPLSTAVGRAVLDYTRRHDLPARAARLGRELRRRLAEVTASRGFVADVRGEGLLIGVDFTEIGGGVPDGAPTASVVVEAARRRGLLLYPAGVGQVQRTVVVAPPLTIQDADLRRLVELFDQTLDDLSRARSRPPSTDGGDIR